MSGQMIGKVVMITGASRGIGAEAARLFAAEGASLALLARSRDAIADLSGEIGPKALAIPCDISRFWEVQAAVEATLQAFGRLDVLINNAGIIHPVGAMEGLDPDAFGQTIDINTKGVFHGMRAVAPAMLEQGTGTILTVSSGAASRPVEGWAAYCSSKAAARMLTDCAHAEWGPSGLRVMGLSPGTVATDMQREIKNSGIGPVAQIDWSDHIPPEWPARALLWMCNSDADDCLGQEISLRDAMIRERIGLTSHR